MSQRLILLVVAVLLSGCNLTQAEPTIVPTPDLPEVQILFPENNAQVVENYDLAIDVFAQDATSGIARIEVLLDGESLLTAAPDSEQPVLPQFRVETNWITAGVGRHVISATAYRLDGTASNEVAVIVEVVPRAETTPEAGS